MEKRAVMVAKDIWCVLAWKSNMNKLLCTVRMEVCDLRLSLSLPLAHHTCLCTFAFLQLIRKHLRARGIPKWCFPQQSTIYCLLLCWVGPDKYCGPLHFPIPVLVCMLSVNLCHWGFFPFLFIFLISACFHSHSVLWAEWKRKTSILTILVAWQP